MSFILTTLIAFALVVTLWTMFDLLLDFFPLGKGGKHAKATGKNRMLL